MSYYIGMENTTTYEGFNILVDYGNFYWESYSITRFSSSANLQEALKTIADITGKDTSAYDVSTENKTVTVFLGY
jgi:hypothetical protein